MLTSGNVSKAILPSCIALVPSVSPFSVHKLHYIPRYLRIASLTHWTQRQEYAHNHLPRRKLVHG